MNKEIEGSNAIPYNGKPYQSRHWRYVGEEHQQYYLFLFAGDM